MPDKQALHRRLRAVERTLTDGEGDLDAIREAADATDRVAALESDLDGLDERVAELEAATQALRGYVGNVRSVNESVEQRADAALAAVERLESEREAPAHDSAPTRPAPERRNGTAPPVDGPDSADTPPPRCETDDGAPSPADEESDEAPTSGLLARVRGLL